MILPLPVREGRGEGERPLTHARAPNTKGNHDDKTHLWSPGQGRETKVLPRM